jgi:hypothetical protein
MFVVVMSIEADREANLVSFVNHLTPERERLIFRDVDLQTDKFFRLNLTAGKNKASGSTQTGYVAFL